MKNKRIEEGRNYKMEQRELRKLNKGITLIALGTKLLPQWSKVRVCNVNK